LNKYSNRPLLSLHITIVIIIITLSLLSVYFLFYYIPKAISKQTGNTYTNSSKNSGYSTTDNNYLFVRKWGTSVCLHPESYECIIKNNTNGSNQILFPTRITVNSHDNVLVIDPWNASIYKFTSDGKFITKWGSKGSADGQFNLPNGIAIDSDDNVYISDLVNNRVQKFTNDGKFITKWGSKGSADGQFYNLKGVAVDQNGNVFTIDPGFLDKNNRVQKFTNDGKFITKWGSTCILNGVYQLHAGCIDPDGQGSLSVGDGQFDHPQGIAVDSAGDVYVVDKNNRVQKFTNDGKFITKWGRQCFLPIIGSVPEEGCQNPKDDEFLYPDGAIAVDSAGDVYVVDKNNYRVQKFTNDGKFITKWGSKGSADGQFNLPSSGSSFLSGIAINSKGYVYINAGNDKIQVFAPTSSLLIK
jgi:tripartite motif-containing protein 71